MQIKKCKYCSIEKRLDEFKTCKLCKDGYSNTCKDCYKKKYYTDKIETYKEKYKENRKEKLLYQKEYVILNRHLKRAADAKRRACKRNPIRYNKSLIYAPCRPTY